MCLNKHAGCGIAARFPIVYASTAAIYGDCPIVSVDEDAPLAPLSASGADKCACELHARVAGAMHRIATVTLRFFSLYGPRQDPQSPYCKRSVSATNAGD